MGESMQRLIGAILVFATPLLLTAGDDDVSKELKALQGKWRTVGGEAAWKAFPKDAVPSFVMSIAAEGKATGETPQGEFQFTISVDPKKKTIVNHHESGEQKGKKQYGIYKLEGDKFTVCVTPRGAAETDRPTAFVTKDSANVVFVFERVKVEKAHPGYPPTMLRASAEERDGKVIVQMSRPGPVPPPVDGKVKESDRHETEWVPLRKVTLGDTVHAFGVDGEPMGSKALLKALAKPVGVVVFFRSYANDPLVPPALYRALLREGTIILVARQDDLYNAKP